MDSVQALCAESEIRRLLATYAHRADDGDGSGYAALFATDGVLAVGDQLFEGRRAIEAWLMGTVSQPMRHLMANPLILLESDDAASGTSDGLFFRKADGAWQPAGTARYTDRYVHVGGAWLFGERQLQLR